MTMSEFVHHVLVVENDLNIGSINGAIPELKGFENKLPHDQARMIANLVKRAFEQGHGIGAQFGHDDKGIGDLTIR